MKLFVAFYALWSLPLAIGGSINFETGAPPIFFDTTALRDTYEGLGVTFSGPGTNDGGAILDQDGNFGINAHSGRDFLAFNAESRGPLYPNGGIPQGPETILFAAPVSNVGLWVGGVRSVPMYTLQAYDSSSTLIGSTSIRPLSVQWAQLKIDTVNISRLILSFDRAVAVVDDLSWDGNANAVPEPSTLTLGLLGVAIASRTGLLSGTQLIKRSATTRTR